MALTLLPEEVLEQIIQHLDVKDLLACSAVSLDWREKFNTDVFWKKFCNKEIKKFLDEKDCEVEPSFQLPEQNEERLQLICNWRIHYMRQIHLFKNWKYEKFATFGFRTDIGVVSSNVEIDFEGIHWLFVRTVSEMEIWNITSVPHLHGTVKIFSDCPDVRVFIAGKKAIITQWNIVTIYDLQLCKEAFTAVCRFMVEKDDILPVTLWDTATKTDIDFINEDDDFQFNHFGNLLVGYKRRPSPEYDLSMYLWTINTGKKCKVESILNTLCDDNNKVFFNNIFKINDSTGIICHVFHSTDDNFDTQLYIYDFKKQNLLKPDIKFAGVIVWCVCAHNIIVTLSSYPGTIKFYNYLSGKLLSVKEVGPYLNKEQIQLIDFHLLYCVFYGMIVLDIRNQEVICCLKFSYWLFNTRITVIEPRFVVIWLQECKDRRGCPLYQLDIKDLTTNFDRGLSDFSFNMATNSSSIIKQIINVNGMLCVCTFW